MNKLILAAACMLVAFTAASMDAQARGAGAGVGGSGMLGGMKSTPETAGGPAAATAGNYSGIAAAASVGPASTGKGIDRVTTTGYGSNGGLNSQGYGGASTPTGVPSNAMGMSAMLYNQVGAMGLAGQLQAAGGMVGQSEVMPSQMGIGNSQVNQRHLGIGNSELGLSNAVISADMGGAISAVAATASNILSKVTKATNAAEGGNSTNSNIPAASTATKGACASASGGAGSCN